jgi:hypothetical protein
MHGRVERVRLIKVKNDQVCDARLNETVGQATGADLCYEVGTTVKNNNSSNF